MTETRERMKELLEIVCDADRRQRLTAEELARYCPTVGDAIESVG